jgi:pimeloyl-ACP methyl ester carboxylesterase
MSTYVLIHGAGSDSFYWHWVTPLLEAGGHDVVAPDLPCEDESAGLEEYTNVVVDAIGDRAGTDQLIVVAQSLGGFTAPLVAARVPVELIVMVAAMVPTPGESPGDWWENTGWSEARRVDALRMGTSADAPFDPKRDFFNGVPDDVVAEVFSRGEKQQAGKPFEKPWPLDAWPDVPTRFLLCRDDRFFPAEFQRRVVQERLGIIPDEIDGGHLPAFGRPAELVERLEAYRTSLTA